MALKLGPIVGAVTGTTAKLWFQAPETGSYACHVFHDDVKGPEVPGSPWRVQCDEATGLTAVANVDLPDPDRTYGYDIRDASGATVISPKRERLSFLSFPPQESLASFCFGLVSCHDPFAYEKPAVRYRMWARMAKVFAERDVRFLLTVGDQIYADAWYRKVIRRKDSTPPEILDGYRAVYQQYWRHDTVGAVLGCYPTFMIWDDHEMTDGWGSSLDHQKPRQQMIFQAARQAYEEFQHCHNPTTTAGIFHYAFTYGAAGFLVLDLRGQRNVTRKTADRPLMGARQWADLTAWLQGPARACRIVFVITSVPLIHAPAILADAGGVIGELNLMDQWSYEKFRPEQQDLVRLLFAFANEHDRQVVVLGGDVHVGTVAAIRSTNAAHVRRPLIYQFTSSPIANKPAARLNQFMKIIGDSVEIDSEIGGRMLHLFGERNFGIVQVSYDPNCPTRQWATFELYREGMKEPYLFSTGG